MEKCIIKMKNADVAGTIYITNNVPYDIIYR